MKTTQQPPINRERPVVARTYFMQYLEGPPSLLYIFVYGGLNEQGEHGFVLKPLWMDLPTALPLSVRRFRDDTLEIFRETIIIRNSDDYRSDDVQPGTPEHKKLNDILMESHNFL